MGLLCWIGFVLVHNLLSIGFALNAASDCEAFQELYSQIDRDLEVLSTAGGLNNAVINAKAVELYCQREDFKEFLICLRLENGKLLALTPVNDKILKRYPRQALGYLFEILEMLSKYSGDFPHSLDFVLHISDRPKMRLSHYKAGEALPLVFGYSKADGFGEVLVPYSPWFRCFSPNLDELLISPASGPNQTALLDALASVPWQDRRPVALGRQTTFCTTFKQRARDGRELPCAREHLIEVSEQTPDLLDFQAVHGVQNSVPLNDQGKYKYLVMTDGWTIRTRVEIHMLTESVILWQGSPLYGHWYHAVKAMEHYVPFYMESEMDILDAIKWLREHDKEAEMMGRRAKDFVLKYLHRDARLCYWREVLIRSGQKMMSRSAGGHGNESYDVLRQEQEVNKSGKTSELLNSAVSPPDMLSGTAFPIKDSAASGSSLPAKFVHVTEVIQAILAEGPSMSNACKFHQGFSNVGGILRGTNMTE
ncbi:hypothetical protein CEUSTIGMA_g1917.t1 [Chlamydomonas eustigma]|uniref:Glycosyl transferase CAP10 domain-containing protein n=1 Tax=Chlamydomonas eustigma TaxID=1157962 RepID=A0A250WUH5_9CHLO|nr:hypothetical protein CEUSTIGMA_g1917.t1 [Chlamydomonas eustigma]|eukprot:GAX74468.1 hypothetical protein CEUSTIGMA_g1917.t1 [Chlamydomonas eustigma]